MSDIGSAPFEGYTDGGDFLLEIDNKCVGHCTEHKLKYSAETKDRQVKAAKTVTTLGSSKFKEVTVTDQTMTGSANGYIYAGESELDIDAVREAWLAGRPIQAKGYRRDRSAQADMSCMIVITEFEENYPKGDDATFSISFKNSGAITFASA